MSPQYVKVLPIPFNVNASFLQVFSHHISWKSIYLGSFLNVMMHNLSHHVKVEVPHSGARWLSSLWSPSLSFGNYTLFGALQTRLLAGTVAHPWPAGHCNLGYFLSHHYHLFKPKYTVYLMSKSTGISVCTSEHNMTTPSYQSNKSIFFSFDFIPQGIQNLCCIFCLENLN